MEQKLWVEDYRPREISEIVMSDDNKIFFNKCIKDDIVPNLLFTGPPGSGKTTLARILCDNIIKSDNDVLYMNGSDETGVNTYREKVSGFFKSPPLGSKIKIVFIDEFDYTSQNAQAILRNLIEEFYETGRFICTGNYLSKIIDPLVSRFQHFKFERLSEEFILKYCENILQKEDIKYTPASVISVIRALTPDVRKIINTLQRHVLDNEIKGIDPNTISTTEKKIIGFIIELCNYIGKANETAVVNKNMTQIQNLLSSDIEPDYRFIYGELFDSEISAWAKIKVNGYANRHMSCAIPSIHFQAMILDMLMAGKEYYQMFKEKK